MTPTRHLFFVRSVIAFNTLLAAACTDSVGPIPRAEEIVVRVSQAEVQLRRYDPSGFAISVPLTIANNSAAAVFWNGFCFAEWERLEGGTWKPIERDGWCSSYRPTLHGIPPGTTASMGYGISGSIPRNDGIPDFAKPGEYRFKVILYRDAKGRKQLPIELGISDSFFVVN